MKTCGECKEVSCPGINEHPHSVACDDFTGTAVVDERGYLAQCWTPTLSDYNELAGIYDKACNEVTRPETRITGFEHAIAELIKWAQGQDD